MSIRRRWTIHVPQLVGRISYPQHNEQPHDLMRRIVGEFDTTMQELQRFLRYLQDSHDESTGDGRSYPGLPEDVDASAAAVGDPDLGWSSGNHKHSAAVGPPVGLGNANAEGVSDSLSREDHVHKRDVRVQAAHVDIGTRNALDFVDTATLVFSVVDNGGSDRVEIRGAIPPGAVLAAPIYRRWGFMFGGR